MVGNELTYKIIGCAMKVHKILGNGFQEVIYQRCLAIEFRRAEISFEREKEQTIHYEGYEVGNLRFPQRTLDQFRCPKFGTQVNIQQPCALQISEIGNRDI